jgi:hypothetical protein
MPSIREIIQRAEAGDPEAIAELERFKASTEAIGKVIIGRLNLHPMSAAIAKAAGSFTPKMISDEMREAINYLIDNHPNGFTYGVVLPYAALDLPPETGAAPYNLIGATMLSPNTPHAISKPMPVQTSLGEVELVSDAVAVRARLSPDALRVLTVVCGQWLASNYDERCQIGGQGLTHAEGCKHARFNGFEYTPTALARAVFGAKNGENVARLKESLRELERVEFEWGQMSEGGEFTDSYGHPEPALLPRLNLRRKVNKTAKTSTRQTILLGKILHRQLLEGRYRLIRPELLDGWKESWEVVMVLRLHALYATRRNAGAMLAWGNNVVELGRTEPKGLGSALDLFPTYATEKRWGKIRKALESFCDRLNRESYAHELHAEVIPIRAGRYRKSEREGFALRVSYPERSPKRVKAGPTQRALPSKPYPTDTGATPKRTRTKAESATEAAMREEQGEAPPSISEVATKWATLPTYARKMHAKGYGVALRAALTVAGVVDLDGYPWGDAPHQKR